MDHWRAFFGKAGADIWTIIEQAIILAATDYPVQFKDKRCEIAETLFARRLLQLISGATDNTRLSGSVITNGSNRLEPNQARENEQVTEHARRLLGQEVDRHHNKYFEAEALNDELEEEGLLIKEVNTIKETLMDCEQSEMVIINSLQKLSSLRISVEALKATEIGRHVNNLRKHSSKQVRMFVKQLVRSWKDLVDDWVKNCGDATTDAIASGDCWTSEVGNRELGLPSQSVDESVVLSARTPMELPQVLSSRDNEIRSGEANFYEESYHAQSHLQARSLQGACHSNQEAPEGRESSSRERIERKSQIDSRGPSSLVQDEKEMDHFGRWSVKKSSTGGSGPGRPVTDVSQAKGRGTARNSKFVDEVPKAKENHDFQGHCSQKSRNMKIGTAIQNSASAHEVQVAEKPNVAKRELYEGCTQPGNAKKQRTLQLEGPSRASQGRSLSSKPGFTLL